MASRKSGEGSRFPEPGIDLIKHLLTVSMMQVKGKKEVLLEELVFEGRMTIRRKPSVTIARGAQAGQNKVEFEVITWVASAFSEKLQTEILYILSEDAKQKPSTILAEQKGEDFPAEFMFNVTFDARANNKTIKRRHHGRPHEKGFRSVPPDSKSPTIYGFEDNFIQLKHPEYGLIRFVPRHCNDQSGQTVVKLASDKG